VRPSTISAHAQNPDLDRLSKLLEALDTCLDQVVIVGGWAHRLYRYHPLAQAVPYQPLLTLDTDVALPVTLEVRQQNLRDRLVGAGFREQFFGEEQPPATHYQLGGEDGAFYAEFLTPLIGSEYDREGNRRVTMQVAGVTSQNLRYVDFLLGSPYTVPLSQDDGFPFERPKSVRIAHPTRFMAQKLLIQDKRDRRSRAKDILYLHDTIQLFGASLDVLGQEWRLAKGELAESAVHTVETAVYSEFSRVTDDIRSAAQVAAGRALMPEAIQELCRAGLEIVFLGDEISA
jgi:hypothetical protein